MSKKKDSVKIQYGRLETDKDGNTRFIPDDKDKKKKKKKDNNLFGPLKIKL